MAGGLNPLAAVEECGIPTENMDMKTLFEFDKPIPFWEFEKHIWVPLKIDQKLVHIIMGSWYSFDESR